MDDNPREVRIAVRHNQNEYPEGYRELPPGTIDRIAERIPTEHLIEPEQSYHARQIEAAVHLLRYSPIDPDERSNQYDTIEDHTHNLDAWVRLVEAENAELKASIHRIYDLFDHSILDTNAGHEWTKRFDTCVEHNDFEKWRE